MAHQLRNDRPGGCYGDDDVSDEGLSGALLILCIVVLGLAVAVLVFGAAFVGPDFNSFLIQGWMAKGM